MRPDYLEGGQGPLLVLAHSSVSGARQWRRLMDGLTATFHVKAANLYGYGATPPWSPTRAQTLEDQAKLLEALVPDDTGTVDLVGHSFGGSVAMKAASRLGPRVGKLVLFEPNPFFLLRDNGRDAAFEEIMALREFMFDCVCRNAWALAAERFGDYWGGEGTWAATSPERRLAFIAALKAVPHEWEAVLGETTAIDRWAKLLPRHTLVIYDPATRRPIREIVEVLKESTPWQFEMLPEGGHMAPLSRPDLVNPIIARFLASNRSG